MAAPIHHLTPQLESHEDIVRAIKVLVGVADLLAKVDSQTTKEIELDLRQPVIELRIVFARLSAAIGLPPPGG